MKLSIKASSLFSMLVATTHLMSTNYAFTPTNRLFHRTLSSTSPTIPTIAVHSSSSSLFMFREYGPPSSDQQSLDQLNQSSQQEYQVHLAAFKELLNQVINVNQREHLPRICTQNIDLLVGMKGYETTAICNEVMEEARMSNNQELIDNTEAAIQYVVYFVETFVTEAKAIDDGNKAMLGEIIKCILGRESLTEKIDVDQLPPESQREQNLNMFLAHNRDKFTPGFIRHLEGECNRIQSAPTNTQESMKLLEILRMIQIRVVEELGKELGEGAQVLGQLIGYQNREERLAVLEAGLAVRGVGFASELNALTLEALDGFNKVGSKADPGLVAIVEEINNYIQVYIARNQMYE